MSGERVRALVCGQPPLGNARCAARGKPCKMFGMKGRVPVHAVDGVGRFMEISQ